MMLQQETHQKNISFVYVPDSFICLQCVRLIHVDVFRDFITIHIRVTETSFSSLYQYTRSSLVQTEEAQACFVQEYQVWWHSSTGRCSNQNHHTDTFWQVGNKGRNLSANIRHVKCCNSFQAISQRSFASAIRSFRSLQRKNQPGFLQH